MSLNQSMNISIGSMKNNQYALTVVSHNIANINTEGYHRQRVNFVENQYTSNCENVIRTIQGMNGASISSLTNYIDDAAFKNLLDSNSEAEYLNTLADALGELEGIADDLGENGLNGLLNDFFKASANLEQFPADSAVRNQYLNAAQAVCDKFNDIAGKYNDLQEDKYLALNNEVSTINGLLSQLAEANLAHVKSYQSASTKTQINEILSQLSQYADVRTEVNDNGSINLYLGNVAVVQGAEVVYTLESDFDSTDKENPLKLSLKSVENPDYIIENGVAESFNAGSMKAYVNFLNNTENRTFSNLGDMQKALDSVANAFASEINRIQTQDYTYVDDKGNTINVFAAHLMTKDDGSVVLSKDNIKEMFVTKDGSIDINALNIKVDSEFFENPFLVSAAKIDMGKFEAGEDWTKAISNSDNAVEITAVQNKKICSYNDGKNNCTLSDFLINNASKNGSDLAGIERKAETAQDVADNDTNNYLNLIGVNLDEELSDMIRYQRAFEASARIFSTVNDLMGTIIGMV